MIGRAEIVQVDVRGRETPQRPERPRGTIDQPPRRNRFAAEAAMSSSNPPWESGSPWAQNFSPTVCGVPPALPTKIPPSAARCSIALAVHGALAGPMSMVSQPVQRTPSTIAAMIAAVARRPSLATTTVAWPLPSRVAGLVIRRANSIGDPPRQIRAQVVDRHVADPFRVKQRRLPGPRTDFRQLANLPRGEAGGIVAPRAMAAGRMEAGQSPQMNGAGNRVGFARTAVFGGGKVLDHARYFR